MSQQNKGASSSSPAEVPMKRKRGRPRKDENLVQVENIHVTPGSDTVNNTQQSEVQPSDGTDDDMLGQVVSGFVAGSFDAGYFLTVKVGDTDSLMSGVAFLPGKFTPITEANDVAPHAKWYTRKEITIPVLQPQTQLHSSMPQSEQKNKQPVELENQAPTVSDQVLLSKLRSGTPLIGNMPKNDAGVSLEGQAMPQKTSMVGLENQSASGVAQVEHYRIVEQDETMHEMEELKPDVEMLPCNKTVGQDPQLTPAVAEGNPLTPEAISQPVDVLTETVACPKNDIPQDMQTDLDVDIISGDDASHSNVMLVSDTASIPEAGLPSAPMAGQAVMMVEVEAISSEPKLPAEGSDLPKLIVPQISCSEDPNNNMDRSI